MPGAATPRLHRIAVAALAVGAAFLAGLSPAVPPVRGPSPPPGVLRSVVDPSPRPPVPLGAAVQSQPLQRDSLPAARPSPPAGSAAESEAIRRYMRGRQLELNGQYLRAIEEFDAALRLDEDSPALRAARARVASQVGDGARAIQDWQRALARAPGDVRALEALGRAAFAEGSHPRAVALLGRAWLVLARDPSPARAAERATFGGALARSLFRTGFDAAGVEVALEALGPLDEGTAPPDGLPGAADRDRASLALEAGAAALRCGRPEVAFGLFARSHLLLPDVRTIALAAFAKLRAGDAQGARAALGVLVDAEPWAGPEQAAFAAWLLRELGGDPGARERLGLAALGAEGAVLGSARAPADERARIGMLLGAAGDRDAGDALLAEAVADGARDPLALESALRSTGDAGAPAVAAVIVDREPGRLGEVVGAMLRACRDGRALRAAIEELPEGAARESVAAATLAALRSPGDAWRRAESAHDRWQGRLPLEAMLLAAASAQDPALVARTAALADEGTDSDPAWHAMLARAFALTGAGRDADLELSRAELQADAVGPGSGASDAIAAARAAVDGRAAEGSPRARAEQAIARRDASGALSELLMAREIDPGDAAALGMLVRILPRVEGSAGAASWLDRELAAHPNEPLLWDSLVLAAIAERRAGEALARIDARLSADPDDPMVLPGRESLLRALGRDVEAAAAARGRIASLPDGPRRSLDQAEACFLGGMPEEALEALARFEESAYPPPAPMRAAALDLARRAPPALPARAGLLRRIARDAIEADPRSPLEFRAYEALGAASDPAVASDEALVAVRAIASAAASIAELRADAGAWRAAADLLLAERQPAAGAEFLRARLQDPVDLAAADADSLVRAAVACDAAAGGRAEDALSLVAQLASAGFRSLDEGGRQAGAYASLAGIFRMMGDDAGADRILEAALAVDPTDPGILNNLGYSLLVRGRDLARAEQLLERSLAAAPGAPSTLDSLGWLRYLQGRLEDRDGSKGAVTLLRSASAAAGAGRSAEQLDHLGDALWRSGDREAARQAWTDAVSAATGGLARDEHLRAVLRPFFARVTGLSAADPVRYYDANDGAAAERARAKADAAAQGREPAVAATAPPVPSR